MWVLDHLDDLQADFRVFYRIDNIFNIESASFFKLAMRSVAYKGVMRAHVEFEANERESKKLRKGTGRGPATQTNQKVEKPVAALAMDSDLIELG